MDLRFGDFCLVFVALLGFCVSGMLALGCGNRFSRGLPPFFLGVAFDRGVGVAGSVVVLYKAPDVLNGPSTLLATTRDSAHMVCDVLAAEVSVLTCCASSRTCWMAVSVRASTLVMSDLTSSAYAGRPWRVVGFRWLKNILTSVPRPGAWMETLGPVMVGIEHVSCRGRSDGGGDHAVMTASVKLVIASVKLLICSSHRRVEWVVMELSSRVFGSLVKTATAIGALGFSRNGNMAVSSDLLQFPRAVVVVRRMYWLSSRWATNTFRCSPVTIWSPRASNLVK